MGIEVLDERPYEIELAGGDDGLDLRLRAAAAGRRATSTTSARATSSTRCRLLWRGELEQDGFNALVVRRRPDLVAGQRAARLREVPAPGRHHVQPGLHRAALVEHTGIAVLLVELFEARFDPEPRRRRSSTHRRARRGRSRPQLAEVSSLDQDRILRSLLALITATLRTNAYRTDDAGQPARRARGQARPAARSPTCPQPRPRFEIWVYSPRVEGVHLRFGAGRPRRAALVGPARGLPHRDPRPGQGADGEERRHRADRRQGRLRRQAAAGPGGRPRRVAGRGHRLLPHVHHLAARRSPTTTSPTPTATQHVVAAAADAPLRRRRPVPGRRRRQGHRDVQRHRQRHRRSTTASGSATRSPPAARSATTTRRWASPPAARGSR